MIFKNAFQKYFAGPFLVLFLLLTFSLLVNLPIPFVYVTLNTSFLVFLLLYFLYETILVFKKKKVSKFYLLVLLFMVVPTIGTIQAKIYFGQPVFYGILAERTKIMAFGGLLIIFLLERGIISFSKIESIVLKTAAGVFGLLLLLNIFVPSSVADEYDFVINSVSKGLRIKLNHGLIVILYFYALIAGIEKKNRWYISLVLLILFYLVFIFKARSFTLSLLIASLFYLIKQIKVFKLLSWSIISLVIALVFFSLGYVFFEVQFLRIFELFSSAFNVFLGGEVTDSSALSRISQFEIANNGLKEHPIFGNGFLSIQWGGGLRGYHGYFYPSDIGWMGSLYLYGIAGTLIYCLPFILTWRYAKGFTKDGFLKGKYFLSALIYTMFYLFVHSFTAGFFVKKLGIIVFVFSLIYYCYYNMKDQVKQAKG